METITYLVANYNNARYVEDCIVSLKNQTCDRWRCIICDDKSTDDSVAVIKRHVCSRIRLLENSRNVGYVKTLKRMIAAAPGDVVGIVDSDDALEKDATACVLQAYADDKNASFVFTRYACMDENLRHRLGASGVPGDGRGHSKLLLTVGNVCALRSFRKSLYYRTQGLDEGMLYAEDRDLAYKLEEATRPVFIDKVLYKYRAVPDSQSNDPAKIKIAVRNHYRAKKKRATQKTSPRRDLSRPFICAKRIALETSSALDSIAPLAEAERAFPTPPARRTVAETPVQNHAHDLAKRTGNNGRILDPRPRPLQSGKKIAQWKPSPI